MRIRIDHVTVVVPRPAWRDDEVALVHGGAFAIHSGVRAVAFHDEAQGALGVAVAGRYFAWQDQLQACVQRLRNGGFAAQGGVL
jgi:hypothetical protein